MSEPHIVVIGGGIAGTSAAYHLARHGRHPAVTIVEAETTLGHHTTGRSAAILIDGYGSAPIQALTRAGRALFQQPPRGFCDHELVSPRGMLSVAAPDQQDELARQVDQARSSGAAVEFLDAAGAAMVFPALRPEAAVGAIHDPYALDIDVAAVHQGFTRGASESGASIRLDRRARAIDPVGGRWRVDIGDGETLDADIVVNAAGAWGDEVAGLAGVAPLGLQPLRRTAFMVPGRDAVDPAGPLVADLDHRWYLKPDGPQILCSPADETPSEPCDARPEEIDVARAIDSINAATTLDIGHVASSWAGLRTFAPDRSTVLGPDPATPNFVWCVGQGGTGIQTSPGAGQLVADLTLDGTPGPLFEQTGTAEAVLALRPDRLR